MYSYKETDVFQFVHRLFWKDVMPHKFMYLFIFERYLSRNLILLCSRSALFTYHHDLTYLFQLGKCLLLVSCAPRWAWGYEACQRRESVCLP